MKFQKQNSKDSLDQNNRTFLTGKRVLIFSIAYHPLIGGAEIAVKEITDRMPEYEFDMVTMRFDKSHAAKEKIGNVTVHRIDTSKLLFPIEASLYGKALHKKNSYSIVWSIMAAYAGLAAMFFKLSNPRVKYVLTLQEGDPLDYMKKRARFISPLFNKIFRNADMVQAISNYLGDYARAMGYKGEIAVIPNGVDSNQFSNKNPVTEARLRESLGLKTSDMAVITTSRLVKKNAVDDLIKALSMLPENYKLLILGTGPDRKILESLAKTLGVDHRVKFVGHVQYDEIPSYLHISNVFVRASLSEGFGNSFIEAMAAGVPVVATPVGGIVDFLFDPASSTSELPTGLFAKVRNPESIKAQIMRLEGDDHLKVSIIENAKKMVADKYEWDFIAEEMKNKIFKA